MTPSGLSHEMHATPLKKYIRNIHLTAILIHSIIITHCINDAIPNSGLNMERER
jgi:hypothetical protein